MSFSMDPLAIYTGQRSLFVLVELSLFIGSPNSEMTSGFAHPSEGC